MIRLAWIVMYCRTIVISRRLAVHIFRFSAYGASHCPFLAPSFALACVSCRTAGCCWLRSRCANLWYIIFFCSFFSVFLLCFARRHLTTYVEYEVLCGRTYRVRSTNKHTSKTKDRQKDKTDNQPCALLAGHARSCTVSVNNPRVQILLVKYYCRKVPLLPTGLLLDNGRERPHFSRYY